MISNFLKKNSRTLTIISVLFVLFIVAKFFNSDSTGTYVNQPAVGHVYVLQEENTYAIMRLDSLTENQLYFHNYLYLFADAIPQRAQILEREFDKAFWAIYERAEIQRLYKSGQIVCIYKQ